MYFSDALVICQVFTSHVLLGSTTWDSADIEHVPCHRKSCWTGLAWRLPLEEFFQVLSSLVALLIHLEITVGTVEFYLLLATHALSYLFELWNPHSLRFPGSSVVKNLPAMQEMQV